MKNTNISKETLQPADVTQPFGSYSQGLKVSINGNADFIFITGQIALDLDGKVLHPGDAVAQAKIVFERIRKILEEGGATMKDLVKAQIFLTDMSSFAEVKKIRNSYFDEFAPASTLVEVSSLAREGCCIEVEAMAIKNN